MTDSYRSRCRNSPSNLLPSFAFEGTKEDRSSSSLSKQCERDGERRKRQRGSAMLATENHSPKIFAIVRPGSLQAAYRSIEARSDHGTGPAVPLLHVRDTGD